LVGWLLRTKASWYCNGVLDYGQKLLDGFGPFSNLLQLWGSAEVKLNMGANEATWGHMRAQGGSSGHMKAWEQQGFRSFASALEQESEGTSGLVLNDQLVALGGVLDAELGLCGVIHAVLRVRGHVHMQS
jgi:hypothetical protein